MTSTTTDGRVIWRYATLGGASVVVTRHDDDARNWFEKDPEDRVFRWRCLGCGTDQDRYYDGEFLTEATAQARAAEHAAECRAMPVVSEDTKPSLPAAELCAEIAGVRKELASIAAAVRDLTDKAADPLAYISCTLPDIASAISDAPDPGEYLADIATAVESLAANLERPRWRWFRRPAKRGEVSA